jgi:hypothetical protein
MRTSILTVAALFLVSQGVQAFAADVKTIKGEVVDVSCYVSAGARGADHKTCALSCLQAGEPAGIVEDKTGNLYVVVAEDHSINPSQKLIPYVAKIVEATGTISEKGGIRTIDIKDIKESSMSMMNIGPGVKKMASKR